MHPLSSFFVMQAHQAKHLFNSICPVGTATNAVSVLRALNCKGLFIKSMLPFPWPFGRTSALALLGRPTKMASRMVSIECCGFALCLHRFIARVTIMLCNGLPKSRGGRLHNFAQGSSQGFADGVVRYVITPLLAAE